MGKSRKSVEIPVGLFYTAARLESLGWNRKQISAVLGSADTRLHVGGGITVSLFDVNRVRRVLGTTELSPHEEVLSDAYSRMQNTLEQLFNAPIEVSGEVNDDLPDKIYHRLRKRYSDYRNLDEDGKARGVLSYLRHRYTNYDDLWQRSYVTLPQAGILHDAYRIRAHEALSLRCPDYDQHIQRINAAMHANLQSVLEAVCPESGLRSILTSR